MTHQQIKVINDLLDMGYAIVIITPEELRNASARKVEDRLVELSWDIIDALDDGIND
jgi:Lhr-like helicase